MCQAYQGEVNFWAQIERGHREQECREHGHHIYTGKDHWNTCKTCWKTRKKIRQERDALRKRELAELKRLKEKYES